MMKDMEGSCMLYDNENIVTGWYLAFTCLQTVPASDMTFQVLTPDS